MKVVALALALFAQDAPAPAPAPAAPPAEPASQPRGLVAGGSVKSVTAEGSVIIELDERSLRVRESWTLRNLSGKSVSKDQVKFDLPEGTKSLQLDEGVAGFSATTESILATKDLGSDPVTVSAGYHVDFNGSTTVLRRTFPFAIRGIRVITEDIPGMNLTSSVEQGHRSTDLNGLKFHIYDLAPVLPEAPLELKLSGLPAKSAYPRYGAAAICLAIVAWMLFALTSTEKKASGVQAQTWGPLSARARQDQIVKAIEILDRDLNEEKIKQKKYDRRHAELMGELAAVLREQDLVKAESPKR